MPAQAQDGRLGARTARCQSAGPMLDEGEIARGSAECFARVLTLGAEGYGERVRLSRRLREAREQMARYHQKTLRAGGAA